MKKNLNRDKFERIFKTKRFEVEKRHSDESNELNKKFAENNSFNSGISLNERAELKQNQFKEILSIFIDSIIGSFGDSRITDDNEIEIKKILGGFIDSRIESEKNGVQSAMLSYGHTMGSAIISQSQANIAHKLFVVKNVCLDKLKLDIDNHNDKLRKVEKNSLQKDLPKLEEEQINLLCQIVDAHRNVTTSKRTDFIVTSDVTSDTMLHPGFSKGCTDVVIVDLRILDSSGLIKIYYPNNPGTEFSFTLTSRGFQYYEFIKDKSINPIERIQKEILSFINIPSFEQRYQKAFLKWKESEKLLWSTNTEINLSTVGLLCREALQELLEILITRNQLEEEYPKKDKTKNRVKALINNKNLTSSSTIIKLLEKFYEFWDMLNDLVQRQVHHGLNENETIVLDDAKRVVIYTVIIMKELDKQFY
ncbi:MAG: hypothetical protein IIC75_02885 [Bacteroidetes bacterium]|nr:hypothetical protein [Bacteroidota bacterium]